MKRALHIIPAIFLVLLIGGCESDTMMNPASPAADALADLGWWVLAVGSVVLAIVTALIVVPVFRNRGTLAAHMPYEDTGDTRWIVYGGFALPAIILGGVFVATITTLAQFPMTEDDTVNPDSADADVVMGKAAVKVIGHQWWWEIKYDAGVNQWVTTANELRIPVGRTVTIALETRDVIHSFWVPRLHGKVDLIPGQTNYIHLRADSAGYFHGRCAEYCGAQHTHMEFVVEALPPDQYQAWLAHEASPAAVPDTPPEVQGARLFNQYACNFCHTIRGAIPGGTVAPDLTHFASRETIGAGLLPNRKGYLEAWIINAPSLKPGVQMPALTQFTGDETRALAAYLESLE